MRSYGHPVDHRLGYIMEYQLTFADSEFSSKRRQTRKEIFLSRMDALLPWAMLLAIIEPVYPKAGNGRQPYPLQTMFRIHCLQHWYNLSDGVGQNHEGPQPARICDRYSLFLPALFCFRFIPALKLVSAVNKFIATCRHTAKFSAPAPRMI